MPNILIKYVVLLGESFKLFGFNFGILLAVIDFLKSGNFWKSIVFIFIVSAYAYVLGNNISYLAQDGFLILALCVGLNNRSYFNWFIKNRRLVLFLYFFKWFALYFIIVDPQWGDSFFAGSVFDFGVFKRVQLKGGDVILFFLLASYSNDIKNHQMEIYFITFLSFSAGSRALLICNLILLILFFVKTNKNILFKAFQLLILFICAFLIFNSSFIKARFEKDDGKGEKWRLYETAVVFEEVKSFELFGKGLGSGFQLEIADASPNDDGINLYTHNFLTWIYLKLGIFGVLIFVILNILFLRLKSTTDILISIVFLLLSAVNNYLFTFTGAILYGSFLSRNTTFTKNN
jgi:hypothetical protein